MSKLKKEFEKLTLGVVVYDSTNTFMVNNRYNCTIPKHKEITRSKVTINDIDYIMIVAPVIDTITNVASIDGMITVTLYDPEDTKRNDPFVVPVTKFSYGSHGTPIDIKITHNLVGSIDKYELWKRKLDKTYIWKHKDKEARHAMPNLQMAIEFFALTPANKKLKATPHRIAEILGIYVNLDQGPESIEQEEKHIKEIKDLADSKSLEFSDVIKSIAEFVIDKLSPNDKKLILTKLKEVKHA